MIIVSPIFRLIGKILSYILYAVTLLAAYGGHFNPHLFTIPAVLTLILPYLVILTALTALCWLIKKRWITGALGVLTIFLGASDISSAFPLNFPQKPKTGETTFSLISFNIFHTDDYRGSSAPENRSLRYLINSNADIICLMEIYDINTGSLELKGREALADTLRNLYPYIAGDGRYDFKVLSKYPVEQLNLPHPGSAYEGYTYSFYQVKIKNHNITLAVVHLPSFALSTEERNVLTDAGHQSVKKSITELNGTIRSKMSYAFSTRATATKELIQILDNLRGPVIVCGDFNDVPASWTYRQFMDHGFKDAFSETNFGPMITYNAHLMYFHLDHVLYRGDLRALKLKRGSIDSSDHYPLEAEFAFTQ